MPVQLSDSVIASPIKHSKIVCEVPLLVLFKMRIEAQRREMLILFLCLLVMKGPFFAFKVFFLYFFFHIFLIAELEPVVA